MTKIRKRVFRNMKMKVLIFCPLVQYRHLQMKDLKGLFVQGTDSPETSYVGHFSWIYLFKNQVTKVQDRDIIASAQDQETYGIVPTNDGGGSLSAGEYSNLFDWLNDQKK